MISAVPTLVQFTLYYNASHRTLPPDTRFSRCVSCNWHRAHFGRLAYYKMAKVSRIRTPPRSLESKIGVFEHSAGCGARAVPPWPGPARNGGTFVGPPVRAVIAEGFYPAGIHETLLRTRRAHWNATRVPGCSISPSSPAANPPTLPHSMSLWKITPR